MAFERIAAKSASTGWPEVSPGSSTGYVGRIMQTLVTPELQSHSAIAFGGQCVLEYEAVCAATARVCDLGPTHVNHANWQAAGRPPLSDRCRAIRVMLGRQSRAAGWST